MINRSVISLLKCLKSEEIPYLKKFLNSPFFNSKSQVLDLFNYLIKYYPEFTNESKLDNSAIFKKLYPQHSLNKKPSHTLEEEKEITKLLKNNFYDFKKLLEEFIIYQELKYNEIEKNYLLYNRYSKTREEKLVQKQLNELEKMVITIKSGQEKFYHYYKLFSLKNINSKRQTHNSNEIQKIIENLNYLIILQKLKYGKELLIKESLFNDKNSIISQDELIALADENIKSPDSLISLYSEIILINYENYSLEELKKIIEKFKKIAPNIDTNEALGIFNTLINYSNTKLTQGHIEYLQILYDLYKIVLKMKLLTQDNGYIYTDHYKNIVQIGCGLKEYKWVETFIQEYKLKIDPNLRENLTKVSNSILFFNQGQYEEALKHSQDIEYHDIYDKIIVKNVVMRCYYELNEFYLLDYFADAYKKFLHTNKLIGATRKKRVLNFITFVIQMSKSKSIGQKLDSLYENYQKLLPMECNNWVLSKFNTEHPI